MDKENALFRPSLVVQWLRICLPAQGTQVQSLVREVSTCLGATKPVHPQLLRPHSWVHELQLLKPCSATREVIEMRSALTTMRESLSAAMKIQHSPPKKIFIKYERTKEMKLILFADNVTVCVQLHGLVSKSCPTLGTPWTVLSMGFFRQEYWTGLPYSKGGKFFETIFLDPKTICNYSIPTNQKMQ